jgi:hypothetical protein
VTPVVCPGGCAPAGATCAAGGYCPASLPVVCPFGCGASGAICCGRGVCPANAAGVTCVNGQCVVGGNVTTPIAAAAPTAAVPAGVTVIQGTAVQSAAPAVNPSATPAPSAQPGTRRLPVAGARSGCSYSSTTADPTSFFVFVLFVASTLLARQRRLRRSDGRLLLVVVCAMASCGQTRGDHAPKDAAVGPIDSMSIDVGATSGDAGSINDASPTDDGGSICNGALGLISCAGACVDPSTDVMNCQACGSACDAGQICNSAGCTTLPTDCSQGCPLGSYCSGGQCMAGCENDGSCAVTQICQNGACTIGCRSSAACPWGAFCYLDKCKAACASDEDCPSGQSCDPTSGACVCPGGLSACGDACLDTSSDPGNCGQCGNQCPSPTTCVSGTCSCPGEECLVCCHPLPPATSHCACYSSCKVSCPS